VTFPSSNYLYIMQFIYFCKVTYIYIYIIQYFAQLFLARHPSNNSEKWLKFNIFMTLFYSQFFHLEPWSVFIFHVNHKTRIHDKSVLRIDFPPTWIIIFAHVYIKKAMVIIITNTYWNWHCSVCFWLDRGHSRQHRTLGQPSHQVRETVWWTEKTFVHCSRTYRQSSNHVSRWTHHVSSSVCLVFAHFSLTYKLNAISVLDKTRAALRLNFWDVSK